MLITRGAAFETGLSKTKTKQVQADAQVLLSSYAIAANQTDHEIVLAIDVSQVRAIHIQSDQDCTLETNSGSAADDTIALKANIPYQWCTNDYNSLLLTVDVTKIYITNTTALTLDILVEYDGTV